MRKARIDCAKLTGRDEAHEYLGVALSDWDYRGHNLDALYDVLTSLPGEIVLSGAAQAEVYAQKVLRTLRDAAARSDGLSLTEETGVRIGVGVYIVREAARQNLAGTLRRLAETGYEGAELLGFFGAAPGALRVMLEEAHIEALGDHMPVEVFLKDPDRAVEEHLAVGCRRLTLACAKERIASEPFDALARDFENAAKICLGAGIAPLYHIHDFDMSGDEPFAARMLDAVGLLRFEPDVGWMAVAGQDPARFIEKYRARIPVVHLKDVALKDGGFAFRPTGYGGVNIPALLPGILAARPEWLVVDHDLAYGRDAYRDLALSCEYVKTLLSISP